MKRFAISAFVVLGVLAAAPRASAQTGMARGKVVDDKGQPLAGAKVLWEFQGGVTRKGELTTNKKGEYVQVGLQPGNYKFTASAEGFNSTYIEARVGLGDPTIIPEFKMVPRGAGGAGGGGGDPAYAALKAGVDEAIALANAGKPDEALAKYQALQAAHPTVHQIAYNMGYLYQQKKDWPAAEAAYQKALELKPDYPEAVQQLMNVYIASGQPDKANEYMTKAMASKPDDPRLLLQQATMMFNSGKGAEAVDLLQKVTTLDPQNPEPYFFLASIAVGQGKTAESIAHLEKYLSMNPTNAANVATAKGLLGALKK
jgi:Flp pilus assembly protein TadD